MEWLGKLFGKNEVDPLNPAGLNDTGGWRIVMKDGEIADYDTETPEEAIEQAKRDGKEPLNTLDFTPWGDVIK